MLYTVRRDGEIITDRGSQYINAPTTGAAKNAAIAIYAEHLAKQDNYAELYDYYYKKAETAAYTVSSRSEQS